MSPVSVSVQFTYLVLPVIIIMCYLSSIVTTVSCAHHSRIHSLNASFRHSHYYNKQNSRPRSERKLVTDLDRFLEKLNTTDDYQPDNDNNLESTLNFEKFLNSNDNATHTITANERYRMPSSLFWQNPSSDTYRKPPNNDDEFNLGGDYDDDDKEETDEILEDTPYESLSNSNRQSGNENALTNRVTEHKWRVMTNKSEMDKYFNQYKTNNHLQPPENGRDNEEAIKHSHRMSKETACKVPRPKVIKVSEQYPSSTKFYAPQCTLLHQCSSDSGCCTGNQKCGPKITQPVILYFTAISYYYRGMVKYSTSTVEKLRFYNHTECECQENHEEDMPRDSELRVHDPERPSKLEKSCRCPSEFSVRHLASGQCVCDCFDKQRDCIKYKKGKEYFNHRDRLCMEMETCLQPSCDFGIYNRRSGRCPRKHEKFRAWSSKLRNH